MAKKRAAKKRPAAKKRSASKRPAAKKRTAGTAKRKASGSASKRVLPNDDAWRELIETAIERRGQSDSK